MNVNKLLLESLIELRKQLKEQKYPMYGICDAVESINRKYIYSKPLYRFYAFVAKNLAHAYIRRINVKVALKLMETFNKWPKFSGYISYPVLGRLNFHNTPKYEHFNTHTKAGRLRMELLEFIIKELENESK